MAHRFPADTKLQHFITEQYDKESQARLDWHSKNKRGQASGASTNRRFAGSQGALGSGLPTIRPMAFAIQKKREEDENLKKIILEARKQFHEEEMFPAESKQMDKLFNGFTKEGKGRYLYLDERKRIVPERKYTFPILSSWQYGWKLDEYRQPARPDHARTKLIKDTFYTRNGVPTLPAPTLLPTMERGYTTF